MKKQSIKFRCSSLEKEIIKKKASNSGLTISEYCRAIALNQKIGFKLTDEELEIYKTLIKYHNNFVQISNLLKKKDSGFAKKIMEVVNEIKCHLNKFK